MSSGKRMWDDHDSEQEFGGGDAVSGQEDIHRGKRQRRTDTMTWTLSTAWRPIQQSWVVLYIENVVSPANLIWYVSHGSPSNSYRDTDEHGFIWTGCARRNKSLPDGTTAWPHSTPEHGSLVDLVRVQVLAEAFTCAGDGLVGPWADSLEMVSLQTLILQLWRDARKTHKRALQINGQPRNFEAMKPKRGIFRAPILAKAIGKLFFSNEGKDWGMALKQDTLEYFAPLTDGCITFVCTVIKHAILERTLPNGKTTKFEGSSFTDDNIPENIQTALAKSIREKAASYNGVLAPEKRGKGQAKRSNHYDLSDYADLLDEVNDFAPTDHEATGFGGNSSRNRLSDQHYSDKRNALDSSGATGTPLQPGNHGSADAGTDAGTGANINDEASASPQPASHRRTHASSDGGTDAAINDDPPIPSTASTNDRPPSASGANTLRPGRNINEEDNLAWDEDPTFQVVWQPKDKTQKPRKNSITLRLGFANVSKRLYRFQDKNQKKRYTDLVVVFRRSQRRVQHEGIVQSMEGALKE
ncbi:MAG: hypothetical protein Q9196_002657 [Gyalolechia fulgens]